MSPMRIINHGLNGMQKLKYLEKLTSPRGNYFRMIKKYSETLRALRVSAVQIKK